VLRRGDVGRPPVQPGRPFIRDQSRFPGKTRALPERPARRMYGLLTIETSGCIAFSLPVQSIRIDQALVIDAKPLTVKPLIPSAPIASDGTQPAPRFLGALDQLLKPPAGRGRAKPASPQSQRVLPRQSRRKIFAMARKPSPTDQRADAHMRLSNEPQNRQMYQPPGVVRGGGPAARDFGHGQAFRPSHHPRIRWTVKQADRSSGDGLFPPSRLQEFHNAQQDAYRCHPPGGDPGCGRSRQPRRRV